MQQALVVAATRWMLANPRTIRRAGAVTVVLAAVGVVWAVRAYRAYPSAPEPVSLAEALARADADRGNLWVRVAAPALRCDLAARDQEYTYVPIAQHPLVVANYQGRFDCGAIDASGIVGTIRRPPRRWIERVVGATDAPVYELTTWGGPANVKLAIYLAVGFLIAGLVLFAVGPVVVRRSERHQRLAA